MFLIFRCLLLNKSKQTSIVLNKCMSLRLTLADIFSSMKLNSSFASTEVDITALSEVIISGAIVKFTSRRRMAKINQMP